VTAAKHFREELTATVIMTAVLLAASTFAPARAMADTIPEVQRQGSVQFVAGGIGKDESVAMKQAGADYPLLLEFASVSKGVEDGNGKGEFVADVDVGIRDASGHEVLHTQVYGPLLLVRLPPGHYAVTAQWRGVSKHGDAEVVSGSHRHIVMAW
jgi:hypothetical protein